MNPNSSNHTAALLVATTFLALAPCATAQTQEATERSESVASLAKQDEAGIRKTVMSSEEAWNTHNMKLLATLFREDAEFINVVGMHWRGRDEIAKAHAAFHEIMFKDCRLKTDAIEIRPLGSDCAVAVVTYTQDQGLRITISSQAAARDSLGSDLRRTSAS